jgi:hypothetical protein
MIPMGMMLLVIGLVLPMFFHPDTPFGQNASHAVTGVLLGLSVAINLSAARRAARQRRCTS